MLLDAKNRAMVTLIVVGFLVFSDRERFLKIRTSTLSVLQSILLMFMLLMFICRGKIQTSEVFRLF